MLKKEIDKELNTNCSEKVSEEDLKKEYDLLKQKVKVTLSGGKEYSPKVWVNRSKKDIDAITEVIKIYFGVNKEEIYKRLSVHTLAENSKAKEQKNKIHYELLLFLHNHRSHNEQLLPIQLL